MTVLLLGSTVALLLLSAVASPVRNTPPSYEHNLNLNQIIDLVGEYNGSLRREFVQDVRPLVEAGCGDVFYCKVHDILKNYDNVSLTVEKTVGNLNMFIQHQKAKCPDLLKDVKPTGIRIQLADLFPHLITCIRNRNFSRGNKSKQ